MRRCAALLVAVLHGRLPRARRWPPRPAPTPQRQAGRGRTHLARLTSSTPRPSCWASSTTRPGCSSTRCRAEIDTATTQVAAAKAELAQRRAELADYAVTAYIKGGESDLPDILLKGSGPDVSRQIEYLQAASSSRRQLIDDVRARPVPRRCRAERPAGHAPARPSSSRTTSTQQAGGDQEGVRRAGSAAGQGQRRARHPGGRRPRPARPPPTRRRPWPAWPHPGPRPPPARRPGRPRGPAPRRPPAPTSPGPTRRGPPRHR